jgi:hypothetical protein
VSVADDEPVVKQTEQHVHFVKREIENCYVRLSSCLDGSIGFNLLTVDHSPA